MSRFQQITDTAGDSGLANLFKDIAAHGFGTPDGTPVNWFAAQSMRPDLLAANWAMCKGLMLEGQLPATITQMIMVAISVKNDCPYCRVAHTRALESLDVPQEIIDCLTTDLDLSKVPPHQRAMIEFALKAAQAPAEISDDDVGSLRDFGLSDGEIIEVAMLAAFTNFINSWAEISQIEVDQR